MAVVGDSRAVVGDSRAVVSIPTIPSLPFYVVLNPT